MGGGGGGVVVGGWGGGGGGGGGGGISGGVECEMECEMEREIECEMEREMECEKECEKECGMECEILDLLFPERLCYDAVVLALEDWMGEVMVRRSDSQCPHMEVSLLGGGGFCTLNSFQYNH